MAAAPDPRIIEAIAFQYGRNHGRNFSEGRIRYADDLVRTIAKRNAAACFADASLFYEDFDRADALNAFVDGYARGYQAGADERAATPSLRRGAMDNE